MKLGKTIGLPLALAFAIITAAIVVNDRLGDRSDERNRAELTSSNAENRLLFVINDSVRAARYNIPQFAVSNAEGREKILSDESVYRTRVVEALKKYREVVIARKSGDPLIQEDNKQSADRLAEMEKAFDAYWLTRGKTFELFASGDMEGAAKWRTGTRAQGEALNKLLDEQVKSAEKASERREAYAASESKSVRQMSAAILFFTLVSAAIAIFFVIRRVVFLIQSLRTEMRTVTETQDLSHVVSQETGRWQIEEITGIRGDFSELLSKLSGSMREMAKEALRLKAASSTLLADSHKMAQASEAQAEQTSSAAASVEEMSVSITHISAGADEMNEMAKIAQAHAEEGQLALAEVTEQNRETVEQTSVIQEKIKKLGDNVGNISKIAEVIKDIAGQTNLLALNAAIEAFGSFADLFARMFRGGIVFERRIGNVGDGHAQFFDRRRRSGSLLGLTSRILRDGLRSVRHLLGVFLKPLGLGNDFAHAGSEGSEQ